ncbi:MAG: sulfite exporter TauE/SafE family protein [Solirubrobacterales bacterium]
MAEYIGFGALCFVVAVAGGVAGLVLGNMRLPAAASISDNVAAGGGANVAISAVAAATAATRHIREGRVNWTMFWWLAPPSLLGGLIGGYAATQVSGNALLLFIAIVLFYGSWELSQWLPADQRPVPGTAASSAGDHRTATVAIGLIVGLLGGAVGLILGSLRFPALLRFTDEPPQMLVGTNLSAGVVVGVAGAIGHLTAGGAGFDATLFAIGAATSIPGAWLGAHLTGRLPTLALVRTIAAIVFVAAIAILVQALI